ncbi:MAG: 4Fe-4S binding protein [Candidatus Omnitrophica bacterium]|nr:4Fe-4S binding protein [Candidatus Omnitrophota bacterium]
MKRLFVDLEICSSCKECAVACDYFYHPQNNGISSLREYATFATICRHCEEAPCVNACYHHALERARDGHLKRYAMRCTSCKSCTLACPFGVIFQDFIPYLDSKCDFCVGTSEKMPACIRSCPEKAIQIQEFAAEDQEKDIYFVGQHLAVHARKWSREDIQPQKKK